MWAGVESKLLTLCGSTGLGFLLYAAALSRDDRPRTPLRPIPTHNTIFSVSVYSQTPSLVDSRLLPLPRSMLTRPCLPGAGRFH